MSLKNTMENNKSLSVIIAAAGNSTRLGKPELKSKQFLTLDEKPLLFYSLEKFSLLKNICEIIIVTNDISSTNKLIEKQNFFSNIKIVLGGELRQDSVYNGFVEINNQCDLVLIHDVARPFFNISDVEKCIEIASKSGATVLATPVVDTLKKAKYNKDELIVDSTLDRNNLYLVQTPQVFSYKLLGKAYKRFRSSNNLKQPVAIFTDEGSMVEHMGESVNLVIGSRDNIKITYLEDLEIAIRILQKTEKQKAHSSV